MPGLNELNHGTALPENFPLVFPAWPNTDSSLSGILWLDLEILLFSKILGKGLFFFTDLGSKQKLFGGLGSKASLLYSDLQKMLIKSLIL